MEGRTLLLDAIKDRYIIRRNKWILQAHDGSYFHKHYALHDKQLQLHLEQKKTIGVFSRSDTTKWMCFDVDYEGDMDKAQEVIRRLCFTLEDDYGISRESMLLVFSGSKGYHLHLFFDSPAPYSKIKDIHLQIVQSIGESTERVEFRPQPDLGVKLPFSINKKTGNRCSLIDFHFREIPDESLLDVQKVDGAAFLDYLDTTQIEKTVSPKKKKDLNKLMDDTTLKIPINTEDHCNKMLQENTLIYPDSRHQSTRNLLAFLSSLGYEKDAVIGITQEVISNTFREARHLIDKDTTEDFALQEVIRLYPYERHRVIGEFSTNIRIHENEITTILQQRKKHMRQLLFVLLVHSKKYARKDGTFFMTYKQMNQMGMGNNRTRLLQYIKSLEKEGIVEIVERNRKQKKERHHLPNKYRVMVAPQSDSFIELDTTLTRPNLERVCAHLIPKKRIRELVTREQYYKTFQPAYEENAL